MRSARIELALSSGLLLLPPEGKIAVYRPVAGDDLSALPRERVVVVTGFRPDAEHFTKQGYAVQAEAQAALAVAEGADGTADGEAFAAALVCLPRARAHARALLALAEASCLPGAPIAVDGQKTDGIEPTLKELKGRLALSEVLSKAHGKIAVFAATGAAGPGKLADWAAQTSQVEGDFITCPGVFSADGPDHGSQLLVAALPAKLGPKVVDLGAGWGYLSRAILARDSVKRLDLVEAEALALDCAKRNIDDPRAEFHWADATQFQPQNLVETVVMNPPFHTGRAADLALGNSFIVAARKMMAPDGVLYMVANRHLPYDPVLNEHFLVVEDIGGDGAFRVIRAAKPRRVARKA